jgi:hypothetical protein
MGSTPGSNFEPAKAKYIDLEFDFSRSISLRRYCWDDALSMRLWA